MVQVCVCAEESNVDLIPARIIAVTHMKRLVDISHKVNKEFEGARLNTSRIIAHRAGGSLVNQPLRVILDRLNDTAGRDRAVLAQILRSVAGKVAVMQRRTPSSLRSVIVIIRERGDLFQSLAAKVFLDALLKEDF